MKLPRGPAAVAFEMDGLICDTERLHRSAFLSAAADSGYPLTQDVSQQTAGLTRVQSRVVLSDQSAELGMTGVNDMGTPDRAGSQVVVEK